MSGVNQAMQFFGPQQAADALPWPGLIEAIETAMVAEGGESPDRTMHSIPVAGAAAAMRYQHVAADRNREIADRLNDVIGPLGHGARRRRFAGERLRRVSLVRWWSG